MDDLIYEFLLQSGYPRASILADPGQIVRQSMLLEYQPVHVIIDPDSMARLAVIKTVKAIDADGLALEAGNVEHIAQQIGGNTTQGFVVRYDPRGKDQYEQVQFFRVWPSKGITTLTARNFPDLGSLRVSHQLALEALRVTPDIVVDDEEEAFEEPARQSSIGVWLPGLLLLGLGLLDWAISHFLGISIVDLPQAMLASGAALIFSLAGIARRFMP